MKGFSYILPVFTMIISAFLLLVPVVSVAESRQPVLNGERFGGAYEGDSAIRKKSPFTCFLDYLNDANKNKARRKFDFSIIGGPHHSTDTKFGIGIVAAGLYRASVADTLLPPSNVSLFGDVSTTGFYMLGVRGKHIFPNDCYRIDYNMYFYSFPCYIWGIGYDMGDNDANKTKMKRWQARVKADFLVRVSDNLYAGPVVSYDFVKGTGLSRPELLDGMALRTVNVGIGWSVVYDTRAVLTNPHSGCCASLSQCFRPRFLGNGNAFSTIEASVSGYRSVWAGGTLAAELCGVFNTGNPPWALMAQLGGSRSMRGYYEGRYRDKHKIDTQLELRQHVWRRNGIAVWVGTGSVFGRFADLRADRLLPNWGIGYRWEFKKDVNVRLDYGFGKCGQGGFLFHINEAF